MCTFYFIFIKFFFFFFNSYSFFFLILILILIYASRNLFLLSHESFGVLWFLNSSCHLPPALSPDPLGQVSYCHHFASLFCHLSIYLLSFDISSKITGLILTYLTRSVIAWPSLNIVSDHQPLDNRNIHSETVGSIFTKIDQKGS